MFVVYIAEHRILVNMKFMQHPILKTMKALAALCTIGIMATSFVLSPSSNTYSNNVLISDSIIVKKEAISFETHGHIYTDLNLENLGLSEQVFKYALKGMNNLEKNGKLKQRIISIVDFSQSSDKKRLYVIDLETETLLYNTYVSHGRNTGTKEAMSFSNKLGTYKSSLGFYITANTYQGANGYSLKLHGMERGFNDQAYRRAIVVHGAEYVSEKFIDQQGFLGRSQGCPAVPTEIAKPLIDDIKDGTCLFIYHPAQQYPYRSTLLK